MALAKIAIYRKYMGVCYAIGGGTRQLKGKGRAAAGPQEQCPSGLAPPLVSAQSCLWFSGFCYETADGPSLTPQGSYSGSGLTFGFGLKIAEFSGQPERGTEKQGEAEFPEEGDDTGRQKSHMSLAGLMRSRETCSRLVHPQRSSC